MTRALTADPLARATVAAPADANLGPVRSRPPEHVDAARRAIASGARPADVAEASGVSVRTVYRWLRDQGEWLEVELGGWRATFSVAPDEEPKRITRWIRRSV